MAFLPTLMVVTCLICVTCVLSQTFKVNTDGCSITKTCKFFPSCSASESNCEANRRIITWKKAAASSSATGPLIEIEMRSSPGAGYIAIAFGRKSIMEDADVYYCTSSNTFNTATITALHQPPSKSNLLPTIKSTGSSQIEKSINCRFQRPLAVSKPSTTGEYSYDLSRESFYILAAEGPINPADESLGYHRQWKVATNEKINFTADFPVDIQSTVTTPSSQNDQAKTTASPQTTNKETPTTSQRTPTTSPAAAAQTTSKALSIQRSFCMGWTTLISTIMFLWK